MASSPSGSDARERLEKLRGYLERHYDIHILSMDRLDRGVYKLPLKGGQSWVARISPPDRPLEQVREDAEVLRTLEEHRFPAERLAAEDPVSSPGGRGVLVTKFLEGSPAEPNKLTFQEFGDALGRLNTLSLGTAGAVRQSGALHHFSPLGGGPRNDLEAAKSWLDAVEDKIPSNNRGRYDWLREKVAGADDCSGLPEALIHPDTVLKNVVITKDQGLVLIDWTGAGTGPRLLEVAVMIWSCALQDGGWSAERVDATATGYRNHVKLAKDELGRFAEVMKVRPLLFACWRYKRAVAAGKSPDGNEWWWPSDELVEAIAATAVAKL